MSLTLKKELEGKSVLYRDFGLYVKTEKDVFYKIKKVYIFSNNKIYMIDNYFYDNVKDNLIINGETTRKNKIDLTYKNNFVVKSDYDYYDFGEIFYNLYINADINNYNFEYLKLDGDMFNIYYSLNNNVYNHCIGWNNKKSNSIKHDEKLENIYKYLHYFSTGETYKNDIEYFVKQYKRYIKAIELEKTYTIDDYKKFSLSSGTTEEENKTILINNGFSL